MTDKLVCGVSTFGDVFDSVNRLIGGDVIAFGADPLGVEDSTIAFQNALSEAGCLSSSVMGTFKVSSITIPSNTKISMNNSAVMAQADDCFNCSSALNVDISKLKIDCGGLFYRAVNFDGSSDCSFTDGLLTNFMDGVDSTEQYTAVSSIASKNLFIDGNSFVDVGSVHLVTLGEPSSDSSAGFSFKYNKIVNTVINSGNSLGIYSNSDEDSLKDSEIIGNSFTNYSVPVHINGASSIVVASNTINGNQNGIVVTNEGGLVKSLNVSITGNIILDSRDEAIIAQDLNGYTVTGNIIDDCEFGVTALGSSNGTINNNVIKNITSIGTGGSNGIGILVGKSILGDAENVSVSDNEIMDALKIGVSVSGGSKRINVKSNSICHGVAITNSRGVLLDTVNGSVGKINIKNNDIAVHGVGVDCRGLNSGNISNNDVVSLSTFALKCDDLDDERFTDVEINNNTLDASGAEYALRIDNSGLLPVEDISISANTLNGNGVNSVRIQTSGDIKLYDNNNKNSSEGFVINTDSVDVDARVKRQIVTASLVNADKLVTDVYMNTGSSVINAKQMYGGKVTSFHNSSGASITINPDSGHTINGLSSYALQDTESAIFKFNYSTLNNDLISTTQ